MKDKVSELNLIFKKSGGLYDKQEIFLGKQSLLYEYSIKIKCEQVVIQLGLDINCSDHKEITKKQHDLINNTMLNKDGFFSVMRKTRDIEQKLIKNMDPQERIDILKLKDFYIDIVMCVEDKMCDRDEAVKYFGKAMYGYVNRLCEYLKYDALTSNRKAEDIVLVRFLILNRSRLPESMFKKPDGSELPFGFRCAEHVKLLYQLK